MSNQEQYRPLPDFLTIKNSSIEGLGLFATKDIKANTELGISHFYHEGFQHNYIRTPLGGFINHEDKANCIEIEYTEPFKHLKLVTIKDIKVGQELSVNYKDNNINDLYYEFEWRVSQ